MNTHFDPTVVIDETYTYADGQQLYGTKKDEILHVYLIKERMVSLVVGTASVAAKTPVQVNLNGRIVYFPDQQPYVNADNRTMVLVRFIAEELGA